MMMQETFINATRGERYGDSPQYEPFTDNPGKLFRALRREYGRCTGKVYIDRANGQPMACGWIFESRQQYEDSGRYGRPAEYYTREVWVTLFEREDEITRRSFPLDLRRLQRQWADGDAGGEYPPADY